MVTLCGVCVSSDWESAYIRECGVELVHDVFDPDDFCYEDDDDDSNGVSHNLTGC